MPIEHVTIPTPDADCPAYLVSPSGDGPWPAVIFYGDAGGIRPAILDMATRLSQAGYVVLLPDLYYRFGPYEPLVPREVFMGDVAAILGPLMATTGIGPVCKDTEAYLDTRDDIAGTSFGALGFCMGGGMAIAAAACHSHRFSAVASFHGGHLATGSQSSTHLFVPRLTAQVYVASAENDDSYPPAMAAQLEEAMNMAGVNYQAEVYRGASHGWMVPDFPVHDPVLADRGWGAMLGLFRRGLAN